MGDGVLGSAQNPEVWPSTVGGGAPASLNHGSKRMVIKLIFWFTSIYSYVHSFSSWVTVLSSSCSNSGCFYAQPLVPATHGHSHIFGFLCPLQAILFLARASYSAICCEVCPPLSSLLIFSLIPFFPLCVSIPRVAT